MDVTIIMKVVGVGLIVSVAYQILSKAGRDEQAMLVSLTGVVIVLLMLVGEIARLLSIIRSAFGL
ncbi:MAG: stage III sporulation protein AC [Clostridia bacterium]|nr:stage III sporulation protein AC [Clostridia bacterium]MBQ4574772.1 stage III sporulation protein AC [Clostridia bacterium]